MDTEPQPPTRPQLKILNSSGNPWTGTKVEINGKTHHTDNSGIVNLMGLVGKRIISLWINGKKANIGTLDITQKSQLIFQNCVMTRSAVYQILEPIE